jgi:NADH:ubiquinone oxidoreductase subunit E
LATSKIDEEKMLELDHIINKNYKKEGSLMPILQETQDLFGYISKEVAEVISKKINVPIATLYGVVTFYSQFKLEPDGDYGINVCLGTACYVRGAKKIIEEIEKELGIKLHQTTADGKFTLKETRCLGACGLAPIITINDDVYGKVTVDDIPNILKKY